MTAEDTTGRHTRKRPTGLADWRPGPKGRAVVQIALDHAEEWPMLVRRVLYLAYEGGLYADKSVRSYQSVSTFLGRARRSGRLPWEAIAETTDRHSALAFRDVPHFTRTLATSAGHYRVDRQRGQSCYLLAWLEHRGMAEVMTATADTYGVAVVCSGGFDSTTVRYAEARAAAERAVPTVILHFGDRDQHGENMADTLARDLAALYRDLGGRLVVPQVLRVALTPEQVVAHRLGQPDEDVQVDALPTPTLRALLTEAITSHQDAAVLTQVLHDEEDQRADAVALVERLTEEGQR